MKRIEKLGTKILTLVGVCGLLLSINTGSAIAALSPEQKHLALIAWLKTNPSIETIATFIEATNAERAVTLHGSIANQRDTAEMQRIRAQQTLEKLQAAEAAATTAWEAAQQ